MSDDEVLDESPQVKRAAFSDPAPTDDISPTTAAVREQIRSQNLTGDEAIAAVLDLCARLERRVRSLTGSVEYKSMGPGIRRQGFPTQGL